MDIEKTKKRIVLVENEDAWVRTLDTVIKKHVESEITVLKSYDEAETFLISSELTSYDAIIIDVRMREQIYDQGGLALLEITKESLPQIPVLILTAYAYDYPGLRDITTRYRQVWTYDKEVFVNNSTKILDVLFSLPPQIGDTKSLTKSVPNNVFRVPSATAEKSHVQASEIVTGALLIVLIIASAALVFFLFQRFSDYPFQLNVIFSIVIVTLICVLLRVFKPNIVREALRIYEDILRHNKTQDLEK